MPPASPQGSRAGLITSVVIFTILTLVFIATTIYFSSQDNKNKLALQTMQDKYDKYIASSEVSSDNAQVAAIKNALPEMGLSQGTVLAGSMQQTADLAKVIKPGESYDGARKYAEVLLNNTKVTMGKSYNINVPNDSLTSAIQALQTAAIAKVKETEDAQRALADAKTKYNADVDADKAEMAKAAEQVAAARKDAEEAKAKADVAVAEKEELIKKLNDASNTTVSDAQKQIADATAAAQKAAAYAREMEVKAKKLNDRLGFFRFDVKMAIMNQADGHVTRVLPGQSLAYIDLGTGDHLTAGLQFEVYDKTTGIPPLGDGTSADGLPVGKASLEVLRVGQNSSECRIVKTKLGETISEGDYIVNIVYDRNYAPTFFVYGDFDPTLSNQWTPQNADVIKSLVQRWGGRVADHVGINTDFVVMGREPVIPTYTKEDLEKAYERAQYDKAKKALDEYNAALNQARDLHIPVMNQARFFYYTGHWDSAKR